MTRSDVLRQSTNIILPKKGAFVNTLLQKNSKKFIFFKKCWYFSVYSD
nr:MAG TPA: hypothetical protein [Caudoviricetes sp.]